MESPTVTYTVEDDDGDQASKTFVITVEADLVPTLEAISDSDAKLTKVFTLQLPLGSGGDGGLEYDATGLPLGLSFVESSRTITGTPTKAGDHEVTYTASDEDSDVARQTFHIVVYALPSLSEVTDVMATKDEVFTLVLSAVSGGKAPFDYAVTGLPSGLPTGLSFVESSLTITGTPTQIQVADVTFAVEDADGDTASQEFKSPSVKGTLNLDSPIRFPISISEWGATLQCYSLERPAETPRIRIRFPGFPKRFPSIQIRDGFPALLGQRGRPRSPIRPRTETSTRYRKLSPSQSLATTCRLLHPWMTCI